MRSPKAPAEPGGDSIAIGLADQVIQVLHSTRGVLDSERSELEDLVTYWPPSRGEDAPAKCSLVHSLQSGRVAIVRLRKGGGRTNGDDHLEARVLSEEGYTNSPRPFRLMAPEAEGALPPAPLRAALLEQILQREGPLHLRAECDQTPLLASVWDSLPLATRRALRFASWDTRVLEQRAPVAFVPPSRAEPSLQELPSAPQTELGRLLQEALKSSRPKRALRHAEAFRLAGRAYLELVARRRGLAADPSSLPALLRDRLALETLPWAYLSPMELLVTTARSAHGREHLVAALDALSDPGGELATELAKALQVGRIAPAPALRLALAAERAGWLSAEDEPYQRVLDVALSKSRAQAAEEVAAEEVAELALRVPRFSEDQRLLLWELVERCDPDTAGLLLGHPCLLQDALRLAWGEGEELDARALFRDLLERSPERAVEAFLELRSSADTRGLLRGLLAEVNESLECQSFARGLALADPDLCAELVHEACDQPWRVLAELGRGTGGAAHSELQRTKRRLGELLGWSLKRLLRGFRGA